MFQRCQLDKDKHVGAFTDHFNAALAVLTAAHPRALSWPCQRQRLRLRLPQRHLDSIAAAAAIDPPWSVELQPPADTLSRATLRPMRPSTSLWSSHAAMQASKESAPPITSTGKGYKGKKPITLTIPSPLGKGQGQGAAAAAPGPRSPGWAPDGLSRMTRVDSKNYFDIAPTLTADGLKHQWDTESVASMLIDDHVGESSGYLQVNLAGRRTNGLGYISVMVE